MTLPLSLNAERHDRRAWLGGRITEIDAAG
jgi:hypothetical protein